MVRISRINLCLQGIECEFHAVIQLAALLSRFHIIDQGNKEHSEFF